MPRWSVSFTIVDITCQRPGTRPTSRTKPRSDIMPNYDVIVVGARAAGASTAMLLARRGARVLVVERSSYGSDTLSTHALMRGGVRQLHRWGLLEKVALATPTISRTIFEFGDSTVVAAPRVESLADNLFAPRRTVLDPILVDAARDAGAEVRFNTVVSSLIRDNSGRVGGVEVVAGKGSRESITADLVVGADGLRSFVARQVGAPVTYRSAHSVASIISYQRGADLPINDFIFSYRDGCTAGSIPTSGWTTLRLRKHGAVDISDRGSLRRGRLVQSNVESGVADACRGSSRRITRRSDPEFPWISRSVPLGLRAQVGRWSAMPATSRIRPRPTASATPFETQN